MPTGWRILAFISASLHPNLNSALDRSHAMSNEILEPISSIDNLNVGSQRVLITPHELKTSLPVSADALATVERSRATLRDILLRKDPRLFVVVGPCSIHDIDAAHEYAARLKTLANEVAQTLFLVMRVYFEKPRTTVGWKGLINDPHMNDSFKIEQGLQLGRKLLIDISELGLATATEALDPIAPQYLQDLICWSAIGARTTESQTHREMASGLSSAVGFKNGTDGGLTVATNALQSVAKPHRFLGINEHGQVAVTRTTGNEFAHLVLRGGSNGPNFQAEHIQLAEQELAAAGVAVNIMVDCSHANSNKDPARQTAVIADIAKQIQHGNRSIVGLMVESNLNFGRQDIPEDLSQLSYGVSVTDGCIDWASTEQALRSLDEVLQGLRSSS